MDDEVAIVLTKGEAAWLLGQLEVMARIAHIPIDQRRLYTEDYLYEVESVREHAVAITDKLR